MSRRRWHGHRRAKKFGAHVLYTASCMGTAWLLHLAVFWIVGLPWPVLAISALVVLGLGRKAALGTLYLGGLGLLASPTVVLFLGGASIVIGLVVHLKVPRTFVVRSLMRHLAIPRPQQASDRVAGLIEASFTVRDTTRPLGGDSRHQSVVDDYLGRGTRLPPAITAHAAPVVDAHFSAPDRRAPNVIAADRLRRIERHLSEDAEPRMPPALKVRAARVVDTHFSVSYLPGAKVINGDQYRRIEGHLSENAEPLVRPAVTAHAARVVDAHFSPPELVAAKWVSGDQYRRIENHLSNDVEWGGAPVFTAHAARVVEHHFNPPDPLRVFDRLPSHARQRYLRTVYAHVVT